MNSVREFRVGIPLDYLPSLSEIAAEYRTTLPSLINGICVKATEKTLDEYMKEKEKNEEKK